MLTTDQQEHFTQQWTQAQSTVACFVNVAENTGNAFFVSIGQRVDGRVAGSIR